MPKSIEYASDIKGVPDKAILAFHGWQGNRCSFQFLSGLMRVNNVEWFFPEAPYILDNNPKTRSWSYEKSPGVWEIEEPNRLLTHFFNTEIFSKYSSEDIYIIGFSQGAIICFEFALHMDQKLGGIFPIAGMYRDKDLDKPRFHPNQKDTPIVIGHGNQDDVINIDYSKKMTGILDSQGANVRFIEFNGGHKISIQYIKEITKVINNG